jgi:hypothetical protein
VLDHNQGLTSLDFCDIDYCVLANGLRGNSRLKVFIPSLSSNFEVGNRQVLAVAGAVKENEGLVDLDFCDGRCVSDETWDAMCDSLKTHPTFEVLGLCAPSICEFRIQALVNMLKVNMSIHIIYICMTITANMSFFDQSFLVSRRIGSGHAFLPSKNLAQ